MPDETRRPSATQPIDREALFDELEARGEVVACPLCGIGRVSPKLAQRIAGILPAIDRERPTLPAPAETVEVPGDDEPEGGAL